MHDILRHGVAKKKKNNFVDLISIDGSQGTTVVRILCPLN